MGRPRKTSRKPKTRRSDFAKFRFWARAQFTHYSSCVAFIEIGKPDGDVGIGTCFHVGDGVFVTARHVIEGRTIRQIGFDDIHASYRLIRDRPIDAAKPTHGSLSITGGPFYHPDKTVDVACFQTDIRPGNYIPLGGHLDDWLGQYELVLHRTLVMGYPPIPLSDRPVLVASLGEINALVGRYIGGHPHFIISTMARGGFSGGPALVAYDEDNEVGGTAALGLVTESLNRGDTAPELGYMAVLTVEPIYRCLEVHKLLPSAQKLDIEGD